MPAGIVVDYQLQQEALKGVVLKPDGPISQVVQGDTLFVPLGRLENLQKMGYNMLYYLQRKKGAPEISTLSEAVDQVVRIDGVGKVEVKSAEMLKQRLNQMEQQQGVLRLWLAGILGSALALIYGVLSILEFRQSMYVSALLRSFGVSPGMLGLRTVVENALIVNVVTLSVIVLLYLNHNSIFKALNVKGFSQVGELYWGGETMWIVVAANVGIVISSLPVFWALRKPVGSILE
jgi:hypothetical protein